MNKNLLKLSLYALTVVVLLSACSKDDDEKSTAGYFKVDGKKTGLTSAVLLQDTRAGEGSDGNPVYYHQAIFFPEGATYESTSGVFSISSLLLSSGEDKLVDGTYVYTGNDDKQFLIYDGYAALDVDITAQESGTYYEITEGEAVVSVSGDTYTIDFEGKSDGHTIVIHYVGEFITMPQDDNEGDAPGSFTYDDATVDLTTAAFFYRTYSDAAE